MNRPDISTSQWWLMILSVWVVVLLPFGRLSELPIIILAAWGLLDAIRHRQQIASQPWFWPFTASFLCYFLMITISAVDSFWAEKSWLIAGSSWRFYFMGLVLLHRMQQPTFKITGRVIAVVAMIWVVDALIQYVFGSNLLGLSSYPGRLTGVFGDNVKLGPVLALLMPLLLIQLNTLSVLWRYLATGMMILVILLSGTRSAWLMMGFVMLLYAWHHVKGRRWLLMLKTMTLVAVVGLVLWFSSTEFQQRLERTTAIFQADSEAINFALADRLPIWKTAINMYQAHPVNGVGARAFRVVYEQYAEPDDVWVAAKGGGLHAHHWVLELMSETGTVGLLLMLVLLVLVVRHVHRSTANDAVWPYAIALMAAMLPVVSLYSLFSSFWSICLWWLLIMMMLGVKYAK